MIAAVGLGAAAGLVLFGVLLLVAPPRPAPAVELARFDARPARADQRAAAIAGGSPGGWLAAALSRRGVALRRMRQDLALTGQTVEQAFNRRLLAAAAGLVSGLAVLAAATGLLGVQLPAPAAALPVVWAAALFFVPDVRTRAAAAARRAEFRRALGAYLDLVALEMAGSAAPAEALPAAARIGTGWPFAVLRDTLYRATRAGRSPWTALAELGERIGVDELSSLGQLIALVAQDGARVRSTLTARAQTMRRHALADLEGRAGKADQSMRLAQIVIGLGFVTFLIYPALVAILAF